MDKLNRAFAETLKELRTQRLITQEVLAKRAGIDRAYLSGLERGLHLPSLSALVRLAGALGLTASDLVSRIEQRKSRRARRVTSSQAA